MAHHLNRRSQASHLSRNIGQTTAQTSTVVGSDLLVMTHRVMMAMLETGSEMVTKASHSPPRNRTRASDVGYVHLTLRILTCGVTTASIFVHPGT
jgi:hypothetical protein